MRGGPLICILMVCSSCYNNRELMCPDMDEELRSRLREEYSNSANFSDGEIFRFIRLYHKQGRELEEKKWWARLTRDKSKDLKRILDVKELREGFDNLLEITGLWEVFHIGTMRRYLVLRSHQVKHTSCPARSMLTGSRSWQRICSVYAKSGSASPAPIPP